MNSQVRTGLFNDNSAAAGDWEKAEAATNNQHKNKSERDKIRVIMSEVSAKLPKLVEWFHSAENRRKF